MNKKAVSTYEREMKNPAFRKAFDKSYNDFLLSELAIATKNKDRKSIKELAKEIGSSLAIKGAQK